MTWKLTAKRLAAALAAVLALPLLAVLPSTPASGTGWSGPQASIVNVNGRKVIQICDQGGGCRTSTPFFLGINTQTPSISNHDWSAFMYESQMLLAHTANPANGIVPVLQVNLASTADASVDELADHLNQLNPRPYLFVRFYLQDAPATGAEHQRMQDVYGNVADDTGEEGSPWTMNEAWLAYQEQQIARVLTRMDADYPGRVLGLHIAYGNGGEWFYRPYGYQNGHMKDWGDPNWCVTGNGGSACGVFPPTNDSAAQPGPIGRQYFYLDDYSASAQSGFCSWSRLPASLVSGCRAATTAERNNADPAATGTAVGRARGVFLDPADVNSRRAAAYNQYLSSRYTGAITRLLGSAKQLTGGRILTSATAGYLYGLATEAPISGQTDFATLLASDAIDIVVAPGSYGQSRSLGYAFLSQGPSQAPIPDNKLWVDEDDTRTFLACPSGCKVDGFQTVTTLWDSIRILRRNVLTEALTGRGGYFDDLAGGWYGRTGQDPTTGGDLVSESDTMWANMEAPFKAIAKLQLGGANAFKPQVAVFVDDLSENYLAGLTAAGESSYGFASDLEAGLVDNLSRLGTPVRHYLLSDLTKSNLDLSAIKLAILPNAFQLPASMRATIDAKLKTPGRTILSIYAPGYLQDEQAASAASISAFTGISVARGTGTPTLSQTYTSPAVSGGPDYPLTPWFTVTDGAATVLGRYSQASGNPVSLARKTIPVPGGSWTSVYAAAPRLPLSVLRQISEDAGVFHFAPAGDVVEASGNMVMLHANTTGSKTITLPQTMPRVYETALYPDDVQMCTNCAQLGPLDFNAGDTRIFRWTTPPRGNFEAVNGTSAEGWAADLDQPGTASAVDLYQGGPPGTGTYLGRFTTTVDRPDVNSYFGITGVHGFSVPLSNCPTGTSIYAYAVDPEQNGDPSQWIGTHSCN